MRKKQHSVSQWLLLLIMATNKKSTTSDKQQTSLARFFFTGSGDSGDRGGEKRPSTSSSRGAPPEKRKKQKDAYKDIRERKFLQQWKESFTWLEFDEDTGLMHCKVCRAFPTRADQGGSFFIGTKSFVLFC